MRYCQVGVTKSGLIVETFVYWITIGAMFLLGVILLLTWIDTQK